MNGTISAAILLKIYLSNNHRKYFNSQISKTTCIYLLFVIFIFVKSFHPDASRNLNEVFTYNHMDLISLLRRFLSGIHSFNESLSFMYKQLYNITSKYYIKTYINGQNRDYTGFLLLVCLTY